MFKNVLVGVGGAGGGRDAITLAKELREVGGHLTLAHVYFGDPHTRRGSPTEHDLAKRASVAELLETASKNAGVQATTPGKCPRALELSRKMAIAGEPAALIRRRLRG